ncbi:hypothetical protein C9412_09705 [Stenotrophomonas sp. Nf1]|nr:hypothetical protein C9412_09705 [Stenotrophomonas sp. Nf1]PTA81442.1 hypothetical protein C9416_07255 [Stenotrophomonas sp. Nf4]
MVGQPTQLPDVLGEVTIDVALGLDDQQVLVLCADTMDDKVRHDIGIMHVAGRVGVDQFLDSAAAAIVFVADSILRKSLPETHIQLRHDCAFSWGCIPQVLVLEQIDDRIGQVLQGVNYDWRHAVALPCRCTAVMPQRRTDSAAMNY